MNRDDYAQMYGGKKIDFGFNTKEFIVVRLGERNLKIPKKINAGLPAGEWRHYPHIAITATPNGFKIEMIKQGTIRSSKQWDVDKITIGHIDPIFFVAAKEAGIWIKEMPTQAAAR